LTGISTSAGASAPSILGLVFDAGLLTLRKLFVKGAFPAFRTNGGKAIIA
jgi:hypothetical protein